MVRKANYPISPIILNRWSPRAFDPKPIPHDLLMTLFEAARWAPSSYNTQPWRFLYATRDSKEWNLFLNLLVDANKQWAQNASVLVCLVSRERFEYNGKPSRTHSFDAGSAWENIALQASISGLAAHGMEGFDYVRAKQELHVPDGYSVEMMFAIGYLTDISKLTPEQQLKEQMNDRRPLEEIVQEGRWNFHESNKSALRLHEII